MPGVTATCGCWSAAPIRSALSMLSRSSVRTCSPGLDPQTGRPEYDPDKIPDIGKRAEFCPSVWGGKDWPPSAYNPKTGYVYIPANENLCGAMQGEPATYRPGDLFVGLKISDIEIILHEDAKEHIGELQAWDMNTGKQVWTTTFRSHNWGPVLTTGGGLVFSGRHQRPVTSAPLTPQAARCCGSSGPTRG